MRENILAICYDFDRTLSPNDMQAQGYIQRLNENVEDFWHQCQALAHDNQMDPNLAYMYLMLKGARGKFEVKKEKLLEFGSKVELYPGVENWFGRLNQYAKEHNVILEHYIISSGLKEMIEGTSIAHEFKKIYANSFYYDENGIAVWPAQNINFTNKTQFLFRISKGTLDVNDNGVNSYFTPDKIKIPFHNIVYIGDSMTDIPCMKLVYNAGGQAIGVYDPTLQNTQRVKELIRDHRISYYSEANYQENSYLDLLLKQIIEFADARFKLEQEHLHFKNESKFEN